MARIFNIYFSFEGQVHNAVVSVKKNPFFTEYILLNFNENLLQLLPGNKIISQHPDHYIFQNADGKTSGPLMDSILRAVAEHMHATEA